MLRAVAFTLICLAAVFVFASHIPQRQEIADHDQVVAASPALAILPRSESERPKTPLLPSAKLSSDPAEQDDAYVPNEDDDYVAPPRDEDAKHEEAEVRAQVRRELYQVIKVVDGDTLDVSIEGFVERLRLIGIDTPETVDPRKPVQCFGLEASNKAKDILAGKLVELESDPTQGERDKYGRLLRYVRLPDGTNFNMFMISGGYAHEYTYSVPYRYQEEFREAEAAARASKAGLWADGACSDDTRGATASSPGDACAIKGNISSGGEKIYHMVGCAYYDKTTITESVGEKWFCSESEAESAGWRKAKNC